MRLYLPISTRTKGSIRQPKELTAFSIDIDNEVHLDDRCLSYYYFPDTVLDIHRINLASGFKTFLEKDESIDHHLDPLLKSLIGYEKNTKEKAKADIITYRGIMTKLLCLPYEQSDDIDLNIILFDDQIFIEEDHVLRMSKKRPMDEKGKILAYGGYKFEKVATLPRPWSACSRAEIDGRYTETVNNIEQYCTVVRTGVGQVKVIIGAEVDCVHDFKPETGDALRHYGELKTSRAVETERDARNFERKLLKTWAQSFLIGLPKIYYGFRDDNSELLSVEQYKTEDLPVIIKDSNFTSQDKKWNGNQAISWYAALIDWIVKVVRPAVEGTHWRLQYKANSQHVELLKLEDQTIGTGFILKEFVEHRERLTNNTS